MSAPHTTRVEHPVDGLAQEVITKASPRIRSRGRAYFGAGRVLTLAREGQTLRATVDGSGVDPYEVEISRKPDDSWCNCPFDWEETCKHAVAVAYAWLANPESPVAAPPIELFDPATLSPPEPSPLREAFRRMLTLHGRLLPQRAVHWMPPQPALRLADNGLPAFQFTYTPDETHDGHLELIVDLGDVDVYDAVRCWYEGDRLYGDLTSRLHWEQRLAQPYALAAVEAILRSLAGDDESLHSELRGRLSKPSWFRRVAALDAVLESHHPQSIVVSGAPGLLGWQVRPLDAGGIELSPLAVRAKKRGDGYVFKRLRQEDIQPSSLPESVDARVAELLFDSSPGSTNGQAAHLAGLALLAGHPRVFFRGQDGQPVRVAVRRSEFSLRLEPEQDGAVAFTATLDGTPVAVEAAARLIGLQTVASWVVAIDPTNPVLYVAQSTPRLNALIRHLATDGASVFPAEAVPELLPRVARIAQQESVSLDASVGVELTTGAPDVVVRFELSADQSLGVALIAHAPGMTPSYPLGWGPNVALGLREGHLVQLQRDIDAEREVGQRTAERLGLDSPGPDTPFEWRFGAVGPSLEVIAACRDSEDVTVEWTSDRRRSLSTATSADLRVDLSDRHDWFGLGGGLEIDGTTVEISHLLAAIRDGRRFVRLEGGEQWVELSTELRQALSPIARLAQTKGGEVTLPAVSAPLIDAVAQQADWLRVEPLDDSRLERFRGAVSLEVGVPATLAADLRDYQRIGFEWLARLAHWAPGACLADEMGLGKTVQALALLLRRASHGPALVVAPTSVGLNWVRETGRFASDLRTRLFRSKTDYPLLDGLDPGDVLITSYDLVRRHIEAFSGVQWSTVVLDEAQAIKNPGSARARAITDLNSDFTLALTGTPLENRTGELWSLFRCIVPGLLGSRKAFHQDFAVPIERDADVVQRDHLSRLIRPFVLRRLKAAVAPELPKRTEVNVEVQLSEGERKRYEEVRQSLVDSLSGLEPADSKKRFHVFAGLTRLRQLACDPQLVYPGTRTVSSKLNRLQELLEQLRDGGHRALVFSQFTGLLRRAHDAARETGFECAYLDGKTPVPERQREIDRFQRNECDAFFISLKAGGTGLNLTAANFVVHLDPWWNPAVEDQATDRAHRIGQEQPVTIYRLVAHDTIEERVLALHAEKRDLVESVLDGTSKPTQLSTDDLLALMR